MTDKNEKPVKEAKAVISRIKMMTATHVIRGTAPYVSNKFSAEMREKMRAKMATGSQSKKGAKRDPKDFEKEFKDSIHWFADGKPGMPASSFRAAMISACRLIGFKMTLSKLAVFIDPDGFDADPGDATPLVRFAKGEPAHFEAATRNATGVPDIRVRGRWDPGWEVEIRIRYDADVFSATDVRNLLERVGMQVGIGAGRHDSKTSTGMGWGTFEVLP